MLIDICSVTPEGKVYAGEEPASVLDLDQDHFARADGPIEYELEARLVSQSVVVSGRLKSRVKLLCGRCGGFFSTTLEVSSFLRAFVISEQGESIDLTPDIREDVLLAVPSFPACSWLEKTGVCPHSGRDLDELRRGAEPPDDARWSALDVLDAP